MSKSLAVSQRAMRQAIFANKAESLEIRFVVEDENQATLLVEALEKAIAFESKSKNELWCEDRQENLEIVRDAVQAELDAKIAEGIAHTVGKQKQTVKPDVRASRKVELLFSDIELQELLRVLRAVSKTRGLITCPVDNAIAKTIKTLEAQLAQRDANRKYKRSMRLQPPF